MIVRLDWRLVTKKFRTNI